jgi:hypothetical protein
MISAYMRVSCAYCVRNGLVATSTAAIQPARVPKTPRTAHHAAGIASVANSSESTCVAASPRPAIPSQKCSSE